MRTNAEGTPGVDGNAARVWQRGATRRSILDAARVVVAREGVEAFSLNAVAKETGLSITTIFAYYAAKHDLFGALAADDLTNFARSLNGSYMFSSGTAAKPSGEAQSASPEMGEPAAPQTATIVPIDAALGAEVEEPAKQSELPRVDAWLERRLRVFEKSLSDIETRLSIAQRDSASARATADEGIKIFATRLDACEKRNADVAKDLTTRMAAAETRLRDVSTDLRARLLNACTRIDVLEATTREVGIELSHSLPLVEVPPDPAEPAEPKVQQSVEPNSDSYIAAARKAAQTAAALADIDRPRDKRTVRVNFSNRTTMIISAAIVVLFTTGAAFAFAVGYRNGIAAPLRFVVHRGTAVAQRTTQKIALATPDKTPLDRLSALANAGNVSAELLIGLKYYRGEGVAVNLPEAAKWIGRAANADDAMAQFWMGKIYSRGDGVSADASQALHWYGLAAAQGNRQAMHDAGMAYAQGLGTQKDYTQAAKWFEKAAQLGLVNSQFNLAVLYERGEGVPQNLEEAYKWYAVAARMGDYESRTRVDALATALTPRALDRAKAEVEMFRPMVLNRAANVAPRAATAPSRA